MSYYMKKRDLKMGLELKLPRVIILNLFEEYNNEYEALSYRDVYKKVEFRELYEEYCNYLKELENGNQPK